VEGRSRVEGDVRLPGARRRLRAETTYDPGIQGAPGRGSAGAAFSRTMTDFAATEEETMVSRILGALLTAREMMSHKSSAAVAITLVLLFACAARAQGTAGISGAIRDTTGAVLPGVTVEASSPALIEKTRTVMSDESGQ